MELENADEELLLGEKPGRMGGVDASDGFHTGGGARRVDYKDRVFALSFGVNVVIIAVIAHLLYDPQGRGGVVTWLQGASDSAVDVLHRRWRVGAVAVGVAAPRGAGGLLDAAWEHRRVRVGVARGVLRLGDRRTRDWRTRDRLHQPLLGGLDRVVLQCDPPVDRICCLELDDGVAHPADLPRAGDVVVHGAGGARRLVAGVEHRGRGDLGQGCWREQAGHHVVRKHVVFFHSAEVAKNIVHCVAAGTVGEWWFGSHDVNTIHRSQTRALTTSLGSICFGSLVVAALNALETVLLSTQRRKAIGGNRSSANACLECLVELVKRNVVYFNKYAFCQVALYGKDFRTAGSDTMRLFRDRGWSFLLNDNLISSVLAVGCLVVGILSGVIGSAWIFLTMQCTAAEDRANQGHCETFNVVVLTFVACASIGYAMCAIVSSILDSIVSTIFVCFAEDPAALQRSNPGEYARLVGAWARLKPDLLAFPSHQV